MTEQPRGSAACCTCKWWAPVGRRLCPVCIEKHLARNRDRKVDY